MLKIGAEHSIMVGTFYLMALCLKYIRGQRRSPGFLKPKARWLTQYGLSLSLLLMFNPRLSPLSKIGIPACKQLSKELNMFCYFLCAYAFNLINGGYTNV